MEEIKYSDTLVNGDKIRKLLPTQKIDIKDYINMAKMGIHSVRKWEYIRSNIVTCNGDTLWILATRYLDLKYPDGEPIGILEPPLGLVEYVLEKGL